MPCFSRACPVAAPLGVDRDPLDPAAKTIAALNDCALGGQRVLLTGPVASGRTATINAWASEHTEFAFHYVFSAAVDPERATPAAFITGLLSALREYLGLTDALPIDETGLVEALPGWLARLGHSQALIVIDDIDRLTSSDLTADADWLPDYLPPGVVLLASANRGLLAERLRALNWTVLDIGSEAQIADPVAVITEIAKQPASNAALRALAATPVGLPPTTLTTLGLDVSAIPADVLMQRSDWVGFCHHVYRDAARRELLSATTAYRRECRALADCADDPLDQATWLNRAADWPALLEQLSNPAALRAWRDDPFAWQTLWASLPSIDTGVSHLLSRLEQQASRVDADRDELADCLVNAARILEQLNADEAAAYIRRTGHERLCQCAPDSLGAAAVAHAHAVADCSESAPEQALSLLRGALAQRRKALGDDDSLTRSSAHALASVLEAKGDLNDAISAYAQIVATREKTLGRDDPGLLAVLSNLGAAQRAANQLEQARGPFERCLKIARKIKPHPSPALALALDNLAGLLYAGGDHETAAEHYREALNVTESLFGPQHAATAAALHNLGTALDSLSRFPEARRCFRRAVEIRAQALGREHAETATSLHNLAGVLDVTGEREEAESLYREAIETWRAVVGSEHPATATSINNLADLLAQAGRLAEAEPLYRENLALWTALYGEDHPNTAMTAAELGRLCADANRVEEAESLLRPAVVQLERMMGVENALHIDSLCRLAALLRDRGRGEEGLALLENTYERAAGSIKILSPAMQKLRRHRDQLRKALHESR